MKTQRFFQDKLEINADGLGELDMKLRGAHGGGGRSAQNIIDRRRARRRRRRRQPRPLLRPLNRLWRAALRARPYNVLPPFPCLHSCSRLNCFTAVWVPSTPPPPPLSLCPPPPPAQQSS